MLDNDVISSPAFQDDLILRGDRTGDVFRPFHHQSHRMQFVEGGRQVEPVGKEIIMPRYLEKHNFFFIICNYFEFS